MPPTSLQVAPAEADARAGTPPHVAADSAFIERARQMVAFLAQRGVEGAPSPTRHEDALAEWIARWRGMPGPGPDAAQHFVAEELGIIARALNGPARASRLRPEGTDELCWLIARCISRGG